MHPAHVKRKEKTMRTDYQAFLHDPNVRQRIEADARQQRALYLGRAFARLFASLFEALPQRQPTKTSRMLHRSAAW
jgi:hypothetical protein